MNIRMRINRWTEARRTLIHEPSIRSSLVQPHFIVEGEGINVEIESMPGVFQQSADILVKTIANDMKSGISNHMFFPVLAASEKDAMASAASSDEMPLQRVVKLLRQQFGDSIVLLSDVCLCTATTDGHCGVVHERVIDNDRTLPILSEIALSHARAGVDYVCASDMMDGRVLSLRESLEREGFTSTGIMSYSVKYASAFYGPFRDAAASTPTHGDRSSHQMDIRSGYSEAILEASLDVAEGADIVMIKPALAYLDVVREVSNAIERPVAVYNVSGEYSMVMAAAEDEPSRQKMVTEIFHSFKRAGAGIIVSYHTREAVSKNWF